MKESRFSYLIIVLTVIILGIFSRKIAYIPLFIGDFLYAVMIYFGIRFLFINLNKIKAAILSLTICYCIELLQLYDAEWIIALRTTLAGRYILGQGFLWSDMLAYSFGVLIAYYMEKIIVIKKI